MQQNTRTYLVFSSEGLLIGAMTEDEALADILSRRPAPPVDVPPPPAEPPVVVTPPVAFAAKAKLPVVHGKVGKELRWNVPADTFTMKPDKVEISNLPSNNGLRWNGEQWLISEKPNYGGKFTITIFGEKDGQKAQSAQAFDIAGATQSVPTAPPVPVDPRPDAPTGPVATNTEGDMSGEVGVSYHEN